MTERETAKIIALLREYYRDTVSTTETAKVKAWHMLLCDYEYADAQRAVLDLAYSYKNDFMPTPARLIETIRSAKAADSLSAQEAWNLVSKAVSRTDWFNPSKQFDALPPEVQRAIGNANMLKEWGMVDVDTFNTVIYSNFLKAFNAQRERDRTRELLSGPAAMEIRDLADKLAMGAGHEN